MAPSFNPPPPKVDDHIVLSFPTDDILLVTLNRPSSLNCVSTLGHAQLSDVWDWYDATPSLRCAILTGAQAAGKRPAFCSGADLQEWNTNAGGTPNRRMSGGGFAGISARRGKKPVISAVHGICFGGGFEAAGNTDLIIAHRDSSFALPETQRGVVAVAGMLPRLVKIVGMQRAAELALTGRVLTAQDGKEWGFVNDVVDGNAVDAALVYAKKIAGMSPDSVIVSREGLRSAWDGDSVYTAVTKVENGIWKKLQEGENIKEGLRAFVERRPVKWVDSKL